MRLIVPPPVQGLIAAALMWGLTTIIPALNLSFPGQSIVAIILAVVGIGIDVSGILAFIRARTTINPLDPGKARALVVSGIYRVTRNPMYLGLLLLLCGWAVWLGNPVNAIILIGFVAYINRFQIEPEEVILRNLFGEEYQTYLENVRRWI